MTDLQVECSYRHVENTEEEEEEVEEAKESTSISRSFSVKSYPPAGNDTKDVTAWLVVTVTVTSKKSCGARQTKPRWQGPA